MMSSPNRRKAGHPPKTRRPRGYWNRFSNVKKELLTWIAHNGKPGIMPTADELTQRGATDLRSAIGLHGGFMTVAKKLHFARRSNKKPEGYWSDFKNLKNEIRAFIAKHHLLRSAMPTHAELLQAGRGDLATAIKERWGGYAAVARRLRLRRDTRRYRKPRGYWEDPENFERELREFILEQGGNNVMPSQAELLKAGRYDLVSGIKQQGGFPAVARRLRLKRKLYRKPQGYWDRFPHLKQELGAFMAAHDLQGRMPTITELRQARRDDLIYGIKRQGGFPSVAQKSGLDYPEKPKGYWNDFANIKRELRTFMKAHGTKGAMPKRRELIRAGRSDLVTGIVRHGGFRAVAKQLDLRSHQKPQGYWDDFKRVEQELRAFAAKQGQRANMPTHSSLMKAGRSDLVGAIYKWGGFPAVAKRLGLKRRSKPRDYWSDFANVKRELHRFIAEHGLHGVMPTDSALTQARRFDLLWGMDRHGGLRAVAKRLGLRPGVTSKAPGYWDGNLEYELRAFITQQGEPGVMPTHSTLIRAGRHDLRAAIVRHGGIIAVAKRFGLKRYR